MQESLDQVRFKRFSEVGDIANKNITRSEPGILALLVMALGKVDFIIMERQR